MNQLALPDLATVDQQLEAIAVDIELTRSMAAYRIGERLKEAQELFKYKRDKGGFQGWVKRRLKWSEQYAYRFIAAVDALPPGMGKQLFTLSDAAMFEVAKAEPDVQAIIAERVAAGEIFTAPAVKKLREEAAAAAVELMEAEAKEIREKLKALRATVREKDETNAELQDQIAALSTALQEHEDRIAEVQRSLPTPREAAAQAAADPGAGVVLGRDGKFHAGLSPVAAELADDYLTVWTMLERLTDATTPSAARVVMGCDPGDIPQLVRFTEQAIAYCAQLKEAANAKASQNT